MSTPLSEYWLGVEINGQHCAISARQIYASFICKQPLQSANILRLDGVVVHEGEPVYLKPHHVLLKPVQAALTQGAWSRDCEDPSWVIVLKERGRMGLGFRVHKIAGPFHVAMNEGANSVHYGGLDYSIVKVLTN
jgi:hypothetical protein